MAVAENTILDDIRQTKERETDRLINAFKNARQSLFKSCPSASQQGENLRNQAKDIYGSWIKATINQLQTTGEITQDQKEAYASILRGEAGREDSALKTYHERFVLKMAPLMTKVSIFSATQSVIDELKEAKKALLKEIPHTNRDNIDESALRGEAWIDKTIEQLTQHKKITPDQKDAYDTIIRDPFDKIPTAYKTDFILHIAPAMTKIPVSSGVDTLTAELKKAKKLILDIIKSQPEDKKPSTKDRLLHAQAAGAYGAWIDSAVQQLKTDGQITRHLQNTYNAMVIGQTDHGGVGGKNAKKITKEYYTRFVLNVEPIMKKIPVSPALEL